MRLLYQAAFRQVRTSRVTFKRDYQVVNDKHDYILRPSPKSLFYYVAGDCGSPLELTPGTARRKQRHATQGEHQTPDCRSNGRSDWVGGGGNRSKKADTGLFFSDVFSSRTHVQIPYISKTNCPKSDIQECVGRVIENGTRRYTRNAQSFVVSSINIRHLNV